MNLKNLCDYTENKAHIRFDRGEFYSEPYPHIIIDDCFEHQVFEDLKSEFPNRKDDKSYEYDVSIGSLNGVVSYKPTYNNWIKTAHNWHSFQMGWFVREYNLQSVLYNFSDEYNKYETFLTEESNFANDTFGNMLWCSTTDGHSTNIHVDSYVCFWNFIIFMNDKDWEGGDFNLHKVPDLKTLSKHYGNNLSQYPPCIFDVHNNTPSERELEIAPIVKSVESKSNRAIFWPSLPISYHSTSLQTNSKSNRNFVYGMYEYRNGDAFGRRR
tara:strand:- start:65 stop:871 length:807 start_codon:yes stop_codon:yes gene_type:complete